MQYDNRGNRNNFFDESYERPRSAASRSRQPAGKKRKKGGISLAMVFVIDIAVAALALLIFSLYYFIIPRDLGQNAVVLPGAIPSETAAVSASAPVSNNPEQAAAQMPAEPGTESPAVAAVDPNSWRAKFADKFTAGDVQKTDNSYKNANVSISVEKVAKDSVVYFVADIYLADIKYFKTAFANDKFASGNAESTLDIAAANNAVFAVNGDYCTNNKGPVVRNGVLYRDETYKSDVLVMNNDGSMQTFSPEDFDIEAIKTNGAYQVWTFGPMLLKDGQAMETFNSTVNPKNPRTAIGYYEPGHYCFVVVDGRQPGYSDGYSTAEMSQLMASLGCTVAYNLDGGRSSEMAFNGAFMNQPYDGGRGTSDILYIAGE